MKTQNLKRAAAGLAAAALAASAWAAADDIELTVVSWGGAYSASQQNAYHDPYMAANPHVKIVNDDSAGESVAKLRAMNEVGNLTWDLVDAEAKDAIRLCDEGLAEEVNHDEILAPAPDGAPATKDFGETIIAPCFIPQIAYSTTFGYRTDVPEWGGKAPAVIADVFDVEKFPGKRSLFKGPDRNLEWALLADGAAPDEIYDLLSTEAGVDRAFRKLDTIKDHVVWWSQGAQTPQLLADKEVLIGSTFNGRLFNAITQEKQPIAMLWDYQVIDLDGWVIPAGLPPERREAVVKFLRFATDTQRLADQAKYISYAPARASSAPLVGKHAELGIAMAPHMPLDPNNAKNVLYIDYEWWADHQEELDERFQAWLAE